MNMQSFEKPILVLGATGKTGRRVAERLTARGLPVRLGSRNATPAFDWNDRSTWAGALDGVRAVYISYYPDLAVPGAKDAVEALAKLAVEMSIKRLVLLSGRGEEEAQATEEALKALGAELTIVRASWFNQNFSEGAFLDYILAGEVALPVGDVREPFIDADDIADVVVAALTGDWHIGQLYEVTGPRLLTFAEAVGEIAAAAGREVRYMRITPEEFRAGIGEAGLAPDLVWLLDELFTRVLDGRNEYLTDGVERALGRPPRSFTDYAWEEASRGTWNAAQAA
ncbi:MAG: NAD(P)H-binding protein [Rhizobiaceae bacterium]